MNIAGLVKSSLIDYPGLVSAVIFTQGCNFTCGFCHNPELIPVVNKNKINEKDIFLFLNKRVTQLDGVVITGGEPTIQNDLIDFIKKIKNLGYKVKLDTNGSNPRILDVLITEKLVDYVAMDIKGPFEKYKMISGFTNTKVIQSSVEILKNSDIDYEFRTTYVPRYHDMEDIALIGKIIEGAKQYTIQNFRPGNVWSNKLKTDSGFTTLELRNIQDKIKKYVIKTQIFENYG